MLYLMLLYAGLASDQWAVRESAERELIHRVAGWPNLYGEAVAEWAGRATSPEVRRRAMCAVRVWDNWRANSYVPKGIPVWPCIDMMPARVGLFLDIRDRDAGREWLRCQERYSPADGGPYWRRWREATERMARQLIREGVPAGQVDSLLLRAWQLECEAGSDCRFDVSSWSARPWAGGYPGP